jgi:hypothetical protein
LARVSCLTLLRWRNGRRSRCDWWIRTVPFANTRWRRGESTTSRQHASAQMNTVSCKPAVNNVVATFQITRKLLRPAQHTSQRSKDHETLGLVFSPTRQPNSGKRFVS